MSLYDALEGAGLLSNPAPSDLLSVAQAAALLGLARRTVLQHIKAGHLPAVNIGGEGRGARYVLRRADVEAFTPARVGRPSRSSEDNTDDSEA